MRKIPPLNSIRAFEAAARHVRFTKAGQELGVTHGAISRQVSILEEWLGVALFQRLNVHLVLTYYVNVDPSTDGHIARNAFISWLEEEGRATMALYEQLLDQGS